MFVVEFEILLMDELILVFDFVSIVKIEDLFGDLKKVIIIIIVIYNMY